VRTAVAMRLVWQLALLCLLASCADESSVPAPWQQPPSLPLDLRVTIAPTEVALLQPITVTIDRFRQADVEVAFSPKVEEQQFVTEDVAVAPERALGDGFWQRTTMVLLPVEGPGELTIPSFRAETILPSDADASAVPQVATTAEQVITVSSALGAEHGSQIEAPGDPFPTPPRAWVWATSLGALLLAGVLASWFLKRRKQMRHAATIAVPAHVKALRELLRWKTAPRTTVSDIDAFYVGVSQVLRHYLEDRFGVHAPERTTEEFLRELDSSAQLVRDHGSELQQFLSQCDLVKFAKFLPDEAEHERTYQLAESFIDSTRADRTPDPVVEPATAGANA
jgi:hypothetical protein